MSSLVIDFQRDILDGKKSATELLRTAKLIAAKLGLDDITEWVDRELNGYSDGQTVPEYRMMGGGELQIFNPYRGWMPVGNLKKQFPNGQPISEIEVLCHSETVVVALTREHHYPMRNDMGMDISSWQQQISFSPVQLIGLLNAVKDHLLNWAIQLDKRGIRGENMSFNQNEQDSAKSQTFNIQNFSGVLGNVASSQIQIYNYNSVHEVLREHNVPQAARNELENIMDELKSAPADIKPSLLERGKQWLVKNQGFLGAAASVIRKALGLPESDAA